MSKRERQRRYRNTFGGRLRSIYYAMKRRCNNPNCREYKWYGGRGIECRFDSSQEFVDYVVNELQSGHRGLTIDRINNDSHYEPGNIRFVSQAENNRKQRKIERKCTSIFKGVSFQRKSGKWQTHIKVNYKSIYLGAYALESEAARIYDDAALKYFKDSALTNEMMGLYESEDM